MGNLVLFLHCWAALVLATIVVNFGHVDESVVDLLGGTFGISLLFLLGLLLLSALLVPAHWKGWE